MIKKTKAIYPIKNLAFEVWVVDERFVYGQIQYFIKPLKGNGGAWVHESSLIFGSQKISDVFI